MNTNSVIVSLLAIIGITTTPTDLFGGAFWVIVAFLLLSVLDKTKRNYWSRLVIFLSGVFTALFATMGKNAFDLTRHMEIEFVMGLAGFISMFTIVALPWAKTNVKDIIIALIRRKG